MKLFYNVAPPPSSIPTLLTNTTTDAHQYLPQSDTGVVDSCTNHLYISPTDPHGPTNTSTPNICVGTATGHVERLSTTASLPIPQLVADFMSTGYIMSSFTNTLAGVVLIYDADCKVLFANHDVTLFSPEYKLILTGLKKMIFQNYGALLYDQARSLY